MPTRLVIVESPTKAKTIGKFLGKEFLVESSYGHIRDLPKSKLGVDVENGFEPQYITPRKAQPHLTALKKAAKKADSIVLATDEDREGEAIAWHLAEALGTNKNIPMERIVFHEITPKAIENALANPREIDKHLVNAQQARRVLDRIVGYKLSPFLWKKVARGLSAGRVQSVALRLIADREEEINNFKPEEYWTISADLNSPAGKFEALLHKINGETIEKLGIKNEDEAKRIVDDLKKSDYAITSIEEKELKKNPLPPFTTSTLQQASAKRLGFSAQKTMFVAQKLYENGHITYMRTDSLNLSEDALVSTKTWIEENLGHLYAGSSPRRFKKTSKLAQEAHEAIRPTNPAFSPLAESKNKLSLEADEKKLYDLIWRRFVASQLPPANFNALRIEITASADKQPSYILAANGSALVFDGFLKIWSMKFEEKELPKMAEKDPLSLSSVNPSQHFTEPPPRYNEASLIKTLEKYGIGRPSTYAPIIYVIKARNYVEKQNGRFIPTEIGSLVNKVLRENFSEIVDVQFTAKLEEEFDRIAEGKEDWKKVIKDFYGPFSKHLEETYATVEKIRPEDEATDIVCEKCGKPMVIKFGRFGKFIACSGFPECRNTKKTSEPPKSTGIICPDCLSSEERKGAPGELVEKKVSRKGRARGKIFWGCSLYPNCKYATWTNPAKTDSQDEKSEKEPEIADEK